MLKRERVNRCCYRSQAETRANILNYITRLYNPNPRQLTSRLRRCPAFAFAFGTIWSGQTMAVQTAPPPQTPHTGTAQVGPFAFDTGPYTLQCLPIELLPYNDSSVVRNCVLADDSGVAMFRSGEAVYNHPVAQALCALKMLSNYRLTRGQRYIDFAIANAQRLLDRAVMHRTALFIPYPFNYLNSARAHMAAP